VRKIGKKNALILAASMLVVSLILFGILCLPDSCQFKEILNGAVTGAWMLFLYWFLYTRCGFFQ
jgi:hypothetical protein